MTDPYLLAKAREEARKEAYEEIDLERIDRREEIRREAFAEAAEIVRKEWADEPFPDWRRVYKKLGARAKGE